MSERSEPLVRIEQLVKTYPVRAGVFQRSLGVVRAVDGVDLDIMEGETLGLVGESGCGKSTLGRAILRLEEPDSGRIVFGGREITGLGVGDMRAVRAEMQLIFQDPFSSLDPRTTIAESIGEGLRVQGVGRAERRRRINEALEMVGLEAFHGRRFPHEFSGGQRQRVGIARALAVGPRFLVLDEPVSALDVSIQSQILNLLKRLQRDLGLTMLFVAHDLSVVEHLCDRIAVMYLGRIVEVASRDDLFDRPTHPYTEALLSAIPVPDPTRRGERALLGGELPSPLSPPAGCRFHTRCPIAELGRCDVEVPQLLPPRVTAVAPLAADSGPPVTVERPPEDDGHLAACLLRT
jgi:oligopeptide transport system ATP-binding protein